MKGSHQQSSVLSALSKQNLISLESIDDITDDFTGKNKPFIRYLIEDKNIDGN
jgi:type IV pilus assembly protein PilB